MHIHYTYTWNTTYVRENAAVFRTFRKCAERWGVIKRKSRSPSATVKTENTPMHSRKNAGRWRKERKIEPDFYARFGFFIPISNFKNG
ncbi:MAG: hypothetical protein A3B25_02435 [Candidatus Ryanbacteria bacterium RIFCSPLOWO2_01_FULL_48_26]|uniref:Uncharacterized protein n=1 Tax=Candidatus Ryanbacteria bacterium RIFCSPLOWO2_01_FULL_48_26 TaxID=1802126 RepID=A0A1G2GXN4_9BACT|nr:MAG: hypothetical protein A3B25_02435 [Candidatus Ryanbacteria bacterium RIFCSPLOWO2_01_FULL_48_26]